MRLAQIPTEALAEACGAEPNVVCRAVLDATGSVPAARVVDALTGLPLRLLLIVVLALVAHRVARLFISRMVHRFEDSEGRRGQRAETLGGLLGSIAGVVIVAIAAVTVLGEIGIRIGPLLAGLGVLGLAIGFGMQSLVTDFVSGLFLLAEDQFGQGDVIDADGDVGTVDRLSLRTTRIRDVNGHLHHVRNGDIQRLTNMSFEWARAVVDVDVGYDADLDRASAVMKRAADEVAHDDDFRDAVRADPEVWGVQALGADGVTIRLVVQAAPATQWGLARELRKRIKAALDAEGIEIPFPQRTVWLRTDVTGASDLPAIKVTSQNGQTPSEERPPTERSSENR